VAMVEVTIENTGFTTGAVDMNECVDAFKR